ncbi:hypothetical protein HGB24_01495 [Candidatus Saccharibacteria bacterium]|nr:hypothetical protein [Candidatus Saccharibacteria bacterium]
MNTTISNQTIFMSKKGLKELKKQISQLEHDQKKIGQSLREIDKSYNHENCVIRSEKILELGVIEDELEDKKHLLSSAKLFPKRPSTLRVMIGSVVELIDNYGRLFRYTIVDSVEANPSDGRISTESPLGKSLLGRTVRDVIERKIGNQLFRFTLVRIA